MKTGSDRKVALVIDDDRLLCDVVRELLEKEGMKVLAAHTCADGISVCSRNKVDIVLLDQSLPDGEGHELCPSILKFNEQTKIVFITAYPSFENALMAIKGGAYDYLSKPFEMEELSLTVRNVLKTICLENVALIEDYRTVKESVGTMLVGESREFAEVLRSVDLAASTDAPVLITGETGTGKNLVAKAIHYKGAARKEAFICINCAAFPENLIEAELFGYEKGAFTGAESSRKGIFEMAEGGTLFLDEIGEMPLHLQTKLLGVLEEKKIKRLGGDVIRPVNIRIIAATSVDIEKTMDRTLRSDLYYRLSVIRIHIPPLRERREDIKHICLYLLGVIAPGRGIILEGPEIERLMQYDWPGNVRELKNILERACLLQKNDHIRPSELLCRTKPAAPSDHARSFTDGAILPLEEIEKACIMSALENLSYNYTKTAGALKISLSTLKRKAKEYGLK